MIGPTCDTRSVSDMIAAWDEEDALSGFSFDVVKQFKGRGQQTKMVTDLDVVDLEVEEDWPIVGKDNRVYEVRRGIIDCLAAVKLPETDPDVYINKIDWARFPPECELSHLYETFFSQYDREVLMLVGWRRDGSGCRYHVPWQEGTAARVTWKADDEEMGQFQEECFWVGTIHVHPGNSSSPSQTDIDDWAIPEKSGLHLIFARDGSYSIQGAIAGCTFEVGSGNVSDTSPVEGHITTSQGRPYQELLTKPKPIVRTPRKKWTKSRPRATKDQATPVVLLDTPTAMSSVLYVGLAKVGSLAVAYEDAWDLTIVMMGDVLHILTPKQWEEFSIHCEENACAIPKKHSLALKGGGI